MLYSLLYSIKQRREIILVQKTSVIETSEKDLSDVDFTEYRKSVKTYVKATADQPYKRFPSYINSVGTAEFHEESSQPQKIEDYENKKQYEN